MREATRLLLISIVSLSLISCGDQIEIIEIIEIVDKQGFKVLDIKEEENQSTIVAQVEAFDLSNGGVTAVNLFDSDDVVFLSSENSVGYQLGDLILITFENEKVIKVRKNKYNISTRIKGQEIIIEKSEE
jgi:ribosomal protein S4E